MLKPKQPDDEPDDGFRDLDQQTVEFYPFCYMPTWHYDGVCEWSEMHPRDDEPFDVPRFV